jgi:hypothetical protein
MEILDTRSRRIKCGFASHGAVPSMGLYEILVRLDDTYSEAITASDFMRQKAHPVFLSYTLAPHQVRLRFARRSPIHGTAKYQQLFSPAG